MHTGEPCPQATPSFSSRPHFFWEWPGDEALVIHNYGFWLGSELYSLAEPDPHSGSMRLALSIQTIDPPISITLYVAMSCMGVLIAS